LVKKEGTAGLSNNQKRPKIYENQREKEHPEIDERSTAYLVFAKGEKQKQAAPLSEWT